MMSAVRWFVPVTAPLVFSFVSPFVLLSACGAGQEPDSAIAGVTPARAYNDGAITLALDGGPFRPALRIDTGSGVADVGATPFAVSLDPSEPVEGRRPVTALSARWISGQQVDAVMPPGVAPGTYDVRVTDPRGRSVFIQRGFTSLGPDLDRPIVTFDRPTFGAAVGSGAPVFVQANADDRPGHVAAIRWSATSATLGTMTGVCAVDGQPDNALCAFSFAAPAPATIVEPLLIQVEAEDTARNVGFATTEIEVAWIPTVTSVQPTAGSTAGGTAIVVQGTSFVPGLSKIVIDGTAVDVDGGSVESDGSIHGVTLPHLAGTTSLKVSNGSADSGPLTFTFLPPPKIRTVSPTVGFISTSTFVKIGGDHFRSNGDTEIWIGPGVRETRLDATYVSANLMTATFPPGMGVISIFAVDRISGAFELVDGFTYLSAAP
jgi:hypothetical protein